MCGQRKCRNWDTTVPRAAHGAPPRGHRQRRGAVPGAEAQGEVLIQQPRSAQEAGMSPRSPRASGLLYMVGGEWYRLYT